MLCTSWSVVENQELREVFMDEFRKRIKMGPKALRTASQTDPNLMDSSKRG